MTNICFYFQVHQPFRLRKYPVFDIGKKQDYFDTKKNIEICHKIERKCYLPTNKLMLDLIHRHDGRFKVSYSITGAAIEQFEKYSPKVLDSFKQLADTGCVEFLNETYYHSLSFLFSKQEFKHQLDMHSRKMKELFGQKPTVFRNTELIYNNELAKFIEDLGYKAILAEGADYILDGRSPNHVYKPKTTENIRLLLKNYKLSDDIAFRFSNRGWKEHPLTAEKYADWLSPVLGDSVNLFMDYETFGEHQWEDTGIFKFMEHLPGMLMERGIGFHTPSEVAKTDAKEEIDIHHAISWADVERDLSAWLGNKMQTSAAEVLYGLRPAVLGSKDKKLIEEWRKLTISDHLYYMCTKWFNDGDVHKYFNPYDSPYDSFIAFMNIINDIKLRLGKQDLNMNSSIGSSATERGWIKV